MFCLDHRSGVHIKHDIVGSVGTDDTKTECRCVRRTHRNDFDRQCVRRTLCRSAMDVKIANRNRTDGCRCRKQSTSVAVGLAYACARIRVSVKKMSVSTREYWAFGRIRMEIRRRYYCTAFCGQNVAVLSLIRRNSLTSFITTFTCNSGWRERIRMISFNACNSSLLHGLHKSLR